MAERQMDVHRAPRRREQCPSPSQRCWLEHSLGLGRRPAILLPYPDAAAKAAREILLGHGAQR